MGIQGAGRYRLEIEIWRPSFNFIVSEINPYKVQESINRLTLTIFPTQILGERFMSKCFQNDSGLRRAGGGAVRQKPRHQPELNKLYPRLDGTDSPRAG